MATRLSKLLKSSGSEYAPIISYLNNPTEESRALLSDGQIERLEQMSFCEDRLRDTLNDKVIVRKMQAKYRKLKKPAIYEIIRLTRHVYQTVNYKNKDAKRYYHVQMLYRIADKVLRKDRPTASDYGVWERIMAQAAKMSHLDKEDDGMYRPDEIEKPIHIFTSDPSVLGLDPVSSEDINRMLQEVASPDSLVLKHNVEPIDFDEIDG